MEQQLIQSFIELRAGNSHYQYWCLGAPALSGPNLSLTMLPHHWLKTAAPAYSRSPKTNSELPAEMAMYCLPSIEKLIGLPTIPDPVW